MKIDLQDVTETRKKLAVTLEASEVEAEEKGLLGQFSKMAKIPGFRPGKAPVQMVRKRYAKELANELKQRVLSKAYGDGSKEAKIDLVNVVDVDDAAISPGQEAAIIFTVDVRPHFELGNYKGLPLVALPEAVEESEIDEAIESIRRERSEFEPVEREAEKGDYVKFSHEGTIDGQAISEIVEDKPVYAKMPQTWEEVGTDQGLLPGLADKLAGMKTGDKADLEAEFPEDFHIEALQGKKAVYAVEILEVRARKLPELDEEFLKSQQVETVEALREQVKSWLAQRKSQERASDLRRQAIEAVTSSLEFPLPESLVDSETENTMRQVVSNNVRQGVQQEELEKNKEAIYASSRKTAEDRVKLQLILTKIAQAESVEVSNEDLSRFVLNQAYQSGQSPDAFVKELKKDRERLRAAQEAVLLDKTLEFLVEQGNVTDSQLAEGAAK